LGVFIHQLKRISNVIHDRASSGDSLAFWFRQFLHAGRLYPHSSDNSRGFFSGGVISEKRQKLMMFKNKDMRVAGLGIVMVSLMLVMGYSIAQTPGATPVYNFNAAGYEATPVPTPVPKHKHKKSVLYQKVAGEGTPPGKPLEGENTTVPSGTPAF
jgi:hypothetical protein